MGWQWVNEPEDDDDDDQDQGQQNVKDLPAPARKHLRQVEKRSQELEKQLNELRASQRTNNVTDLVKAKGYNAKVAALVPPTVEASDEAVSKWLEEYKDLFAGDKQPEDQGQGAAGEVDMDGVPPDVAQALAQLSAASGGSVTPTKPADLEAQIKGAKDWGVLKTLLEANGVQGL